MLLWYARGQFRSQVPLIAFKIMSFSRRVPLQCVTEISHKEPIRQNGIMTAEEYDRQNRIKKIKSFESEDTIVTQVNFSIF